MMSNNVLISNRVPKNILRGVQLNTLNLLKDILSCSFGPMGSNTIITKQGTFNRYTKDGHTILSSVDIKGEIERAVKEDIESITRRTVLDLGDCSTSIVILAAIIFEKMIKLETNTPPADIITTFKDVVKKITDVIKENGRPTTIEDIYNIALISTNNDVDLASRLKEVYKEYGMDVFIDVTTSNTTETFLKEYNGMTLDSGYCEGAFINDTAKGTSTLKNPRIYAFEDPIDTEEMAGLFDAILMNNMYAPMAAKKPEDIVPTVIICPRISKDLSSTMESLVEGMYKLNANEKPPVNIITNLYDPERYMDLCKLCGCTMIKKYIDPKLQKADIESGKAPTQFTVAQKFYGTADIVESDLAKTKFINPKNMFDDDGNYTAIFKSMIDFLESELKNAADNGADSHEIGTLKRRLNSLKSNLVEICIGGVTVADRDSRRDLLEDAVLNCRSAAKTGVGYGANYEGFIASRTIAYEYTDDKALEANIAKIICDSYYEIQKILYSTYTSNADEVTSIIDGVVEKKCPFNIRAKSYDGLVLSSISSDVVVLETLSKILTLMITSNQFFTPSYLQNMYDESKGIDF